MPAVELTGRKTNAVLWVANGVDKNGEHKVSSPVNIKIRIEETYIEQINEEGVPESLDASIMVDRVIPRGSIIRLGTVATLPSPVTTGLMEVVNMEDIPDVKGRKHQRSVTVKKYKGKLPTVA